MTKDSDERDEHAHMPCAFLPMRQVRVVEEPMQTLRQLSTSCGRVESEEDIQ